MVGLPEGAAVGFCPRLAIHGLGMRGREPVVTAQTVYVCVCVCGWKFCFSNEGNANDFKLNPVSSLCVSSQSAFFSVEVIKTSTTEASMSE